MSSHVNTVGALATERDGLLTGGYQPQQRPWAGRCLAGPGYQQVGEQQL